MPFSNQCLQIGFEACAILARMLEDQFNEAPLARSKVSLNTSARQAMENRYWLLSEEFFKFVGRHFFLVKRET